MEHVEQIYLFIDYLIFHISYSVCENAKRERACRTERRERRGSSLEISSFGGAVEERIWIFDKRSLRGKEENRYIE